MSRLQEIEEAVSALSHSEQIALLHRIESKVRRESQADSRLVMEDGHAVLVAPPNAPVMTPELVKALLADFP